MGPAIEKTKAQLISKEIDHYGDILDQLALRAFPDITDELFDELVNEMKIRDRFDGTLSVVLHSLAKTKFY